MAERQSLDRLFREILASGRRSSHVRVADILHRLGHRSFGPLLLLPALPTLTPISTIPGVATVGAVIILLTAVQMAFGLHRVWLPDWILRRQVSREMIERGSRWLRPVASFVDKVVRARFTRLVEPPFLVLIATACILLSFVMFPLQLVPFTSGIPSFPVAILGLALIARDGLLAIVGLVGAALVLGGSVAILMFGGNYF